MKRINKSLPPNPLTLFAIAQPSATWDDFRHHGVQGQTAGADYKATKKLIFDDQGEICAYCEEKTAHAQPNKQLLEHFHSKSDKTNPQKNWALDWNNIFGVCLGGNDVNQSTYPLPANLSCDSHKDRFLTAAQKNNCEGLYINPLHLYAFPCLFDFNKRTGELTAHIVNCQQVTCLTNQHILTEVLVTKTIEVLNLNCDRLKSNRLEVLKFYNQEVTKARKSHNKQIFEQLAQRWFSQCWLSFFTTRRILLGQHAEKHLHAIGYNG